MLWTGQSKLRLSRSRRRKEVNRWALALVPLTCGEQDWAMEDNLHGKGSDHWCRFLWLGGMCLLHQPCWVDRGQLGYLPQTACVTSGVSSPS